MDADFKAALERGRRSGFYALGSFGLMILLAGLLNYTMPRFPIISIVLLLLFLASFFALIVFLMRLAKRLAD